MLELSAAVVAFDSLLDLPGRGDDDVDVLASANRKIFRGP